MSGWQGWGAAGNIRMLQGEKDAQLMLWGGAEEHISSAVWGVCVHTSPSISILLISL